MWGWKSIERIIEPSVPLREAKEILVGQGFRVHASNPHHVILKSAGTDNPWTTLSPSGVRVVQGLSVPALLRIT